MIPTIVDRFYNSVQSECIRQPSSGTVTDVVFNCTTDPASPTLWAEIVPLLALLASMYGIVGALGDYFEYKDKNFKERAALRKPSGNDNDLKMFYQETGLRHGQNLQYFSKLGIAGLTLVLLAAYYIFRAGLGDVTSWSVLIAFPGIIAFYFVSKNLAMTNAVKQYKHAEGLTCAPAPESVHNAKDPAETPLDGRTEEPVKPA